MIKVDRCAEALRFLFLQVFRPSYHRYLTSDGRDMHIFVESLRSTEATGIAGTYIDIFRRVETNVGTGTEYHIVYHVVLVHTRSDQEAPPFVFPFVLQEKAFDVDLLVGVAVITDHFVFQMVVVVFQSGGQV